MPAMERRWARSSPFLHLGSETQANSLAIIHLSRDRLHPLYLQEIDGEHDGYAEGAVLNTRFGSFPHSTFINVPWGSQIRASEVDTGSRGKKQKKGKPSGKHDQLDETATPTGGENTENTTDQDRGANGEVEKKGAKKAVAAASGFVHILAPTPELWTMSLPHRTQVVYTPDYSYILQRIRARPGGKLIEAGAGSGSFTHASARAVYNGVPNWNEPDPNKGKVFSFEFNEKRYKAMCTEIAAHRLDPIVQMTHRDVYKDGFLVDGKSPGADAVFLDLPAPWEALPHLARRRYKPEEKDDGRGEVESAAPTPAAAPKQVIDESFVSPLNPKKSVYLCTFSPCIEQVTRTVSAMRRLGWMGIETVEIANKRIHVQREKVGLTVTTDRGSAQTPADVNEAVERLRKIEERVREHMKAMHDPEVDDVDGYLRTNFDDPLEEAAAAAAATSKSLPPFMQGRLVTRPEPEMRSHTSYLTFAVLPREWTAGDEAAAFAKWPCGQENAVIGSLDKAARKQQKRELLEPKKKKKKKAAAAAEKAVQDQGLGLNVAADLNDAHETSPKMGEEMAESATPGDSGLGKLPGKRTRDLEEDGEDGEEGVPSKRVKRDHPQQD